MSEDEIQKAISEEENLMGYKFSMREYSDIRAVCQRLLASGQFISVKELREKIEKITRDLENDYLTRLADTNTNNVFVSGTVTAIGELKRRFLAQLQKSQEKIET